MVPSRLIRYMIKVHSRTTVLVVEDEALIRIVLDAFSDAGFGVLEASNANEAVVILRAEAHRVHGLFTDINMPGSMDGVKLAHHAREQWPWIALFITSGIRRWGDSELHNNSRFFLKPYDIAEVTRHVRQTTHLTLM